MNRSLIQLLVLFTLLLAGRGAAQQSTQSQEVLVRSWQRGPGTVLAQTINVSLTPSRDGFETMVAGGEGKMYKLRVIHNPLQSVKTEHWKVELREVSSTGGSGQALGDNLLLVEPPAQISITSRVKSWPVICTRRESPR